MEVVIVPGPDDAGALVGGHVAGLVSRRPGAVRLRGYGRRPRSSDSQNRKNPSWSSPIWMKAMRS